MLGFNLLKCEHRDKCSGYQVNSFTCTKALDKSYCGKYNRIEEGEE